MYLRGRDGAFLKTSVKVQRRYLEGRDGRDSKGVVWRSWRPRTRMVHLVPHGRSRDLPTTPSPTCATSARKEDTSACDNGKTKVSRADFLLLSVHT